MLRMGRAWSRPQHLIPLTTKDPCAHEQRWCTTQRAYLKENNDSSRAARAEQWPSHRPMGGRYVTMQTNKDTPRPTPRRASKLPPRFVEDLRGDRGDVPIFIDDIVMQRRAEFAAGAEVGFALQHLGE